MRRVIAPILIATYIMSWALGVAAGQAQAVVPHPHRSQYVLVGGNGERIRVITLRHCGIDQQEDSMGHLVLVDWDPDNSRATYRCASTGY